MNLFVDGRGQAGVVEELTPPKITIKTEEDRSGGQDAPEKIDVGMEVLDSSFTLKQFNPDVLGLMGVISGSYVPFVIRAAIDDNGTAVPVVWTLRGKFTEQDPGTLGAGKKVEMKCTVNCVYYKLEVGGKVIHEIDVKNAIRIVNGVDHMKAYRDAAGL
jgi:P2 family phage contractile tail tube protein